MYEIQFQNDNHRTSSTQKDEKYISEIQAMKQTFLKQPSSSQVKYRCLPLFSQYTACCSYQRSNILMLKAKITYNGKVY